MKRFRNAFPLVLLLFLISCATQIPVVKQTRAEDQEAELSASMPSPFPEITETPVLPPEKAETPPQLSFLTIVAAGDNLYHEVMIKAGEEGDYDTTYGEIRPIVEKADIAFINQETLLAGKDFGFSGFPKFNSPQKIGRAIAAAGFNVVNQATNHTMDKGEDAVIATMNFWDTIPGVTVLGIHRSEDQRNMPTLVKKNNISVGFLSYTYGTNNLPVPPDKSYLVSLIDTDTMAKEIDSLRPLCDFLVVSMHWGEEYQQDCNTNQEKLAAFLAEHQVDLVLGHHPHVLQPVKSMTRPDGGTLLCFYSLGNLVSAQTENTALLGALAYIRIEKKTVSDNETAETTIANAGAIPLVTHYENNFSGFKVYPLYAYTEELLAKHWKNQRKEELTMDYLTTYANKALGDKEIKQNPFD